MKKICLSLFLLAAPSLMSAKESKTPTLTVSAQGTFYAAADELHMNIGVVTIKDTAESALQENNEKMEAIIENLKAAGLAKKDYETGRFSITPTYTPYPKEAPPNWRASINGYEVNNTILIHTTAIGSAGKLIDAANKAGANNINGISFVLHDDRAFMKEAINLATANAIDDAHALANAAGLNLVRIQTISLENNQPAMPRSYSFSAKSASYDSVPSIEAGDVKITANVSITYVIAPANN